jgi:hypothetical protein
VVRGEACASDFYSALDLAITKLNGRLRRMADRRRVHRGRRAPVSVAAATSGLATLTRPDAFAPPVAEPVTDAGPVFTAELPAEEFDDQPWHIVREKEHDGEPMTVDDALFQMELLGHDFYLFMDKESGRPSVVYRRRAYDYGVIALAA